ncbi:aquaporin AQPAe.a-like [Bombyx mandarina]|uniref:Aquaporin AQPAe.a-like n=1 Tax=Bombyx mandarina TaxID=7092 RepID=A0A6J2JKP8_BOMMA|nr:aquaporin AQPAe.a-like [Bombyx mandarina]
MSTKARIGTIIGINELKNYHVLARQMLSEFLGTFLYLSLILLTGTSLNQGPTGSALANGLLISSIIQFTGHISGGHLNPAITFGVMANGQITMVRGACYIAAQILGSIVGSSVAYAVTVSSLRSTLGTTVPNPNLRAEQIFAIEFLITFILVAVVLSVIDPNRGFAGIGSGAFAIGLSITGCQCSCLPYTGILNPIRSLGPAVLMNSWDSHWVYWVGPISGGVAAGLVYRFLLRPNWKNVGNYEE